MGGFGIWVIRTINTFDNSPDSCTSSTVMWILGHHPHVTSDAFRRPVLALYALSSIPVLNFMLLALLNAICQTFPIWLILCYNFIVSKENALGPQSPLRKEYTIRALSYTVVQTMLIVSTEKTIRSNIVSSEENQWGLGQTSAVLVALLSVYQILQQIWNINWGEKDESKDDRDSGNAPCEKYAQRDLERALPPSSENDGDVAMMDHSVRHSEWNLSDSNSSLPKSLSRKSKRASNLRGRRYRRK